MRTRWPPRSGSAPASPAARPPPCCNRRDRRDRAPPEALEAAFLLIADAPQVWALDSASLVVPEHKDAIVVTGSHGGLLGGRPETALKYDVRGALYNDAGIGKDEAGVSRLPALDARGIAAATVSAASARIGDARSTYEDGIVSRVNARAAALGLREGISAREFVAGLRRAVRKSSCEPRSNLPPRRDCHHLRAPRMTMKEKLHDHHAAKPPVGHDDRRAGARRDAAPGRAPGRCSAWAGSSCCRSTTRSAWSA